MKRSSPVKKFILIPDSFKGTMSSCEVCRIMKEAILSNYPDADIHSIPVADGGEGTVDSFLEALPGEKIFKTVTGPFFCDRVEGYYAYLPDGTAIIEMAAAAALPMVEDRKDPMNTTTFGVGELILDAASRGARKIIIGLGGSCTNDGAAGLAAACGVKFMDADGKAFIPTGGTLENVEHIELSTMNETLRNIEFVTMCDIDNPFYGEEGAAYVYAPQKGADPEMVVKLDLGLRKLAAVIRKDLGVDVQNIPGSGAAGGMGGGTVAYFGSRLEMGIDTVLDTVSFDELVRDADYVYTGEGKIDGQSLRGKVVVGVSRRASRMNVKTLAFVGDIGDDIESAYAEGVTGIFSINRVAVPYKEAKKRAKSDLYLTVDNLLRFQKKIERTT